MICHNIPSVGQLHRALTMYPSQNWFTYNFSPLCGGIGGNHAGIESAAVAAVLPTTPFQPVTQAIWASGTHFMQAPNQVLILNVLHVHWSSQF